MPKRKRPDVAIWISPAVAPDTLKAATEAVLRQSLNPVFMGSAEAPLPEHAVALVQIGSAAPDLSQRAAERGIPFVSFSPTESAAQIRAHLVNALSPHRQRDPAAFHYVGEIPAPPAEYTAHPYTLLPAAQMAGRARQIDLLNEWVTAADHTVRVLSVVAIGGMGKSALTWKWYKDIAPEVMNPLAGRMWWSFYESDAYFENFVIRALAYVADASEDEIREMTPPERERELLDALDRKPFLVVLDGLERILVAYARMDAARLDDEALDEQTQNAVAGAIGAPPEAKSTIFSPNRLRKTADPRAGAFLRKLTGVNASHILISTRLYPADLQRPTGHPAAGSLALFLGGLEDDDALALWRAFGNSGERDELLRIFHTVDNYPLLIRALAGAVARFTPAPGDFAAWRQANPGFSPERGEAARAHLMTYAFSGLSEPERRLLDTIAAFRMPCSFDALSTLLVSGKAPETPPPGMLGAIRRIFGGGRAHFARFEDEAALDAALAELEARGLIGWDQRANRYDLHPIVRGVAWNALDEKAKRGLYSRLNAHFGALPAVSVEDVRALEDLTGPIELYNTLIGLGKYDEAFALYAERLNTPLLRRLSAGLTRVELLEMLFPDGLDKPPKLANRATMARAINALALAYHMTGQTDRATSMYLRAVNLAEAEFNARNVSIGLCNASETLRQMGSLRAAETAAYRALLTDRAQGDREGEAYALQIVGLVLLARGQVADAQTALKRAVRIVAAQGNIQAQGVCHAHLAHIALYADDPAGAREHADQAWTLADHAKFEADFIRAARMQGAAALQLDDLATADECLHVALTRARAANLTEHEVGALIDLAGLERRRGNLKAARSLLDDAREPAERGPLRLLHADTLNVYAQIERDAGQNETAGQLARAAYYLAWCDGEPYAYQRGLMQARAMLTALDAPAPDDLPAFDPARYGAYLDAMLDPPDEFGEGQP